MTCCRYITMPGQALAYKIGERNIRGVRAEAEQRLGAAPAKVGGVEEHSAWDCHL